MASKKKPLITSETKEFILDRMTEGMDITQISTAYPDRVPSASAIYKLSLTDEEFADRLNNAYTVLLMHRMDELHKIAGQTASEAYPHVEDWRQAEAVLKRRMDEAKFVLGKMAPILSTRFNRTEKIEVTGNTSHQLLIVDYSSQATRVIDVTPNVPAKLGVGTSKLEGPQTV